MNSDGSVLSSFSLRLSCDFRSKSQYVSAALRCFCLTGGGFVVALLPLSLLLPTIALLPVSLFVLAVSMFPSCFVVVPPIAESLGSSEGLCQYFGGTNHNPYMAFRPRGAFLVVTTNCRGCCTTHALYLTALPRPPVRAKRRVPCEGGTGCLFTVVVGAVTSPTGAAGTTCLRAFGISGLSLRILASSVCVFAAAFRLSSASFSRALSSAAASSGESSCTS